MMTLKGGGGPVVHVEYSLYLEEQVGGFIQQENKNIRWKIQQYTPSDEARFSPKTPALVMRLPMSQLKYTPEPGQGTRLLVLERKKN